MDDDEDKLTTSPMGRFLKMGALAGRVGFSLVAEKALGLFLNENSKEMRQARMWAKNGEKIAETLGNLKGGAMKIGQMLSIQEGLLPKELTFVLKSLQQNAPSVAFSKIRQTLESDLPDWRDQITEFNEKPLASASIGQVYRARLKDGREVAMKIQYPGIDTAVFSDLKNLRRLFELILESMLSVNLDHIFAEIESRLSEEVDYRQEIKRIYEFRKFYHARADIMIPEPIEQLCSRRVLTTELMQGMDIAAAAKQSVQLRDQWGKILFQTVVEQLLVFEKIQSDPNPANYAFKVDGSLILYDFGSIKELPIWLHKGYLDIVSACQKSEFDRLPTIMKSMQIHQKSGEVVLMKHVDLFRETLTAIFEKKPYTFEAATNPIKEIVDFNRENFDELKNLVIPGDVIFVDRAITGLVASLTQLNATADWAGIIGELKETAEAAKR